jgi:hypothetical protein
MEKPADVAAFVRARSAFLNETRSSELRNRTSDEVIASILAVDGFVALTAQSQPARLSSGMTEQQRLFRKFALTK